MWNIMNIDVFLHLIFSPLIIASWFTVYKKYRDWSWVFFLFFSILVVCWLFALALSYSDTFWIFTKIYLNRITYFLSFIGLYSIVIFYALFGKSQRFVNFIFLGYITISSIIIFPVFLLTPYIISTVEFVQDIWVHREQFWPWFTYLSILYLSFPILLSFFSYRAIKNQEYISKMRLVFLSVWFAISSIFWLLFLVLLPLFHLYFYDGKAVIFLTPFLISILYSLNNFTFASPQKIVALILATSMSFLSSLFLLSAIKYLYIFISTWKLLSILDNFWFFDILAYTILFMLFNFWYTKSFRISDDAFKELDSIQSKFPYTTNLVELNDLLKLDFRAKLFIGWVSLHYYWSDFSKEFPILHMFFAKSSSRFLLNDKVFLWEMLNKSSLGEIENEIPKDWYILVSIKKLDKLVGFISYGKRLLWNYYTSEEVQTLIRFSSYIEWHLKYLDIYSEIHDLNLNLEKRVDEKTIELNATISRQKEFIEVVSHEIRTPLATALFQIEGLEWDILDIKMEKKKIIVDQVKSLYGKITDTVNLVNRLFTIERFEANKIQLYKTKVNLASLIRQQVEWFEKAYKKVEFTYDQIQDVGSIELDIIQFNQVVDNIISNAIKFTSQVQNPKISIALVKQKNEIVFTIEDSWLWFGWVDISKLFDKYSTWKSSSIGLWMGLYLCKKIVELHWGKISASKSKELWWATFKIVLPK